MDLKNTFKSRIRENKISDKIYLAQIDNYTDVTDTISKPVEKEFVQMYFCIKGTATFHFARNEIYFMEKESTLLIFHPKQNVPINISLAKKSNLIIIVIKIQELEKIFSEYTYKLPFYENAKYKCLFREKLLGIQERQILSQLKDFIIDEEFKNIYLKTKIIEIFLFYFSDNENNLIANQSISQENIVSKIQEIKECILENIASPPTLKELSNQVHLSEYKIKEGFKKIIGKSFSTYILDTKLEIGKEKLDLKLKSVKEIAYDLGYTNPSHFIEAFKKKYGITPKQWMLK
ncbi:AraC family transcriptional regulator [Apibacter muscae]|uniref:AraC family transcriptional regulator n=1 Tax=Apibacter muscae TaxID=2509004 RepID=UPI0011AD2D31|nr:AraC family transcriptional regulator [Apibacter muscae]TWP24853.1 AraC family transcriptional regulator [Apibacter muscae]